MQSGGTILTGDRLGSKKKKKIQVGANTRELFNGSHLTSVVARRNGRRECGARMIRESILLSRYSRSVEPVMGN